MNNKFYAAALMSLLSFNACARGSTAKPTVGTPPKTFSTPIQAAEALSQAALTGERSAVLDIFGTNARDLLDSGDPVADKNAFSNFAAELQKKHSLEVQPNGQYVLLVGDKDWPFPFPIVSEGSRWTFDPVAGKEEILDRRVGENELKTIRFSRSYVDAQKEYFSKDRDGDGIKEYALKAISTPGKKDGLYWRSGRKQEQSPFGPLAADAVREGYRKKDDSPIPFHGYYFRILTGQGKNADGGEKSYLDRSGNMTQGFGLLGYPARYGVSGVMTFIVNGEGVVYQRDLGLQTLAVAEGTKQFDPSGDWEPVADPNEDKVEE